MTDDIANPKPLLALGLLLILAALVRALSFAGYFGSDDIAYARVAHQMARQQFEIGSVVNAPVFSLRVGLTWPVSLAFRITGLNEIAMVMYPFLLSLISVAGVYFAASVFFNARAGVIAALIYAVLPIDARSASQLLPDLPAAFWAFTGVMLLYCGSRQSNLSHRWLVGSLAGLAFGFAWLTKESIVYLAPFVLLYLVWSVTRDRRNLALFAAIGLVAAAVLAAETIVYYRATGDLLYRLHETERNYQLSEFLMPEESRGGWADTGYWVYIMKRVIRGGPATLFLAPEFGLVTAVALIAVIYAAARKLRSFVFPGVWFLSLVFMFNFASSTLQEYRPLSMAPRYVYLILFPAVILAAGFINALMVPRGATHQKELTQERRFWGAVVSAGILLVCFWGVYDNFKDRVRSPVERRVARMLSPTDPLFTDQRTIEVLNFFWKYPEAANTIDFEGMTTSQIPRKVFVLINRDRAERLQRSYDYRLPDFYGTPPKQWRVKWSGKRADLFWVP